MKWSLFFVVIAIFIAVFTLRRGGKNNVCKTFSDYYSDRDKNPNCYYNPDHELDVPAIIKRNGYDVNTYKITTEDGYILSLFRISNKLEKLANQKPVLITHGLSLNSGIFVLKGKKSLSFMLVDAGYDVWLGNFRGCRYSNTHVHLSNQDPKYWNYTFHEMGIYDLRSKLNFITKLTKQKVVHIGYSLGVIVGYVYGASYPEEAQNKIDINISLGGTISFNNILIFKIMRYLAEKSRPILQYFTNGPIYPRPPIPPAIFKHLCFPYPIQINFCQLADMIALGFHYEENDPETLPVTFQHNSDAISLPMGIHLLQLTKTDKFYYYDYGEEGNIRMYRNKTPPYYDLSKIKFDNFIYYSENDRAATFENVKIMYNMLPNETYFKELYQIQNKNYNHIDYVTGKNAHIYVYKPVIEHLKARNFDQN